MVHYTEDEYPKYEHPGKAYKVSIFRAEDAASGDFDGPVDSGAILMGHDAEEAARKYLKKVFPGSILGKPIATDASGFLFGVGGSGRGLVIMLEREDEDYLEDIKKAESLRRYHLGV